MQINIDKIEKFIEKNESCYKKILLDKSPISIILLKALDIVKQFIIDNEKIIVGGLALDYSLKLKNDTLYDETEIPDYDMISPTYHEDSYNLANILSNKKYKEISVIKALHISTLRTRVSFNTIADITYFPNNIYKNIKTLKYKKIKFIHPHYILMDQHLNLSHPYKYPPFEPIFNRFKKDLIRNELLYSYYPLNLNVKEFNINDFKERIIPKNLIKNNCLTGIAGLCFWIQNAINDGWQNKKYKYICSFKFDKLDNIILNISKTIKMAIFTDKYKETNDLLIDKKKYYFPILDKIPERTQTNNFEIYHNENFITAFKHKNIFISNIQHIMLVLLTKILFCDLFDYISNNQIYIYYYLLSRDILDWAIQNYKKNEEEIYKKYLPTYTIFGTKNKNESYDNIMFNYFVKFHEKKVDMTLLPKNSHLNFKNNVDEHVDPNIYNFDPKKSAYFQFTGLEKNT